MTKILGNVMGGCSKCGEKEELILYGTVNVTLNPELLEKVKNREINSFHCKKCGFTVDIITPFLYSDMRKRLMIWVYSEKGKEEKKEEGEKKDTSMHPAAQEIMKRFGREVYGYDELFKLLEEKKINLIA